MTTEKSRNDDNFSKRLCVAMRDANISQSDLARALDTAWSTVDRWMKGSIPRKRMLNDLAAVLCVASRWLESGEGPKTMQVLTHPAESSAKPKQPGVSESTRPEYAESSMVREDATPYGSPADYLEHIVSLAATADLSALLDTMETLSKSAGSAHKAAAAVARMIPIVRERIANLPKP